MARCLLERLGDIPAALDIYITQQEAATKQLLEAVDSGVVSPACIDDFEQSRSSQSRLLGPRISSKNIVLPKEVVSASARLKAATSLCRRHSLDLAPEAAQQLWLRVLSTYVHMLGELSLKSQQDTSPKPSSVSGQRLLMFFMEDTIQDMAGFIPLVSLGQRLLSDFSHLRFGNFKSSLVGLLGAYNYELSILQAAKRLTSSDALHLLHSARQAQHRALLVELAASSSSLEGRYEAQDASAGATGTDPPAAASGGAVLSTERFGEPPLRRQETRPKPQTLNPNPKTQETHPVRSGCDINFLRHAGLHGMAGQ